ncbi:uncharacterized protein Dwil_GK23864 [Drosophila willistoni]|uniref:MADF domain-containing protein n=2 Tax=Drosophila willistoni TaxID=7260 RepID=B4MTL0_DROWI|nr:uncharacterized protein Dwil_GK23864 [Drosophila willistoni]
MQADEDFNIRFVNLVRTHKCLYDKKVPEYRNRDNQEKAWVLISKETRESVIHCKERWRNLRACLSRYIKQQNGSEPQHKPYYLTEHMAFLLPFLKSTRNNLDGHTSLATLYHLSQQHLQQQQQQQQEQHQQQMHPHEEHLYCSTTTINSVNNNSNNLGKEILQLKQSMSETDGDEVHEMKQSMSENDDEETIDAFDPLIAATLTLQQRGGGGGGGGGGDVTSTPNISHPRVGSSARSDTASADSLQNFIPDVQLAETGQNLVYLDGRVSPSPQMPMHYHPHHHSDHHQMPKRIKTECGEATTTMTNPGGYSVSEMADMEFFRSILPDIASLTPQQRRKFKIGILELIDDVVARYPEPNMMNGSAAGSSNGSLNSVGGARRQRHSSGRDWRK